MTISQIAHLVLLAIILLTLINRKALFRFAKRSIKARIKRSMKQRKAARQAARRAVRSA